MWKTLSKSEASKIMLSWEDSQSPAPSCTEDMLELRKKLLKVDISVTKFLKENEKKVKRRKDYFYDLKFALEFYKILLEDYQFSERDASNDELWIYLSIRVVPDLVYKRWGIVESRFYKQSRRIWLRTLWWYIHLSWAGTTEETYNVLKELTTDEVVQLVERSGPRGYRIELTREIMRQFSVGYNFSNRNLFRRVMKLNTARLKIVEPQLTIGGVTEYVKELIEYFENTDGNKNTRKKIKDTTSN